MTKDERRLIPRTDELLALPSVVKAQERLSPEKIRSVIAQAQDCARRGVIPAREVSSRVEAQLDRIKPHSLSPVVNATGVIVHTNLGRAPLPPAAIEAMVAAAGYTDVELDMETGRRCAHRGQGSLDALLIACPEAQSAAVVNNGAAALLLSCAALAQNKEVIVSRGELIEIGAGFRLPELIESAHVVLREVGATNRTHPQDYRRAMGPGTGAILKVHPSNYKIEGFTSSVSVSHIREQCGQIPVIVDLGSGLLTPEPLLPEEPDITAQLRAGADVVIASGDKLLGGPQAGILLGKKEIINQIVSHPLYRALRLDKIRLAALEAAIIGAHNEVLGALKADTLDRTRRLAQATGGKVVAHDGRVGGGGAPGFPLPGWAVSYPEELAARLRQRRILPRVKDGRCLVDLRCVPAQKDDWLAQTIAEVK